ncbi:MAG: 2-C-methyl-D-erythritol 2,4-cyclodiphosphate synthase [Salinivirgaceae bacterium]|nr:2-C-methyl-D-erythritol 2,4-cyclodiphosphate synthase [Salinivirgaceae bacterium]
MIPRIGFGYDVHQLAEGETFILGGIKIEHYNGTIAHSDGDVLVHAMCDAILGAAALGDIGKHYPDNDPTFKNIDSCILLGKCCQLIREQGYEIGNIDSTIALQKPKIGSYLPSMIAKLSEIMSVEIGNISIKATTTEKLGFVGKQEGVEAYSSVLIYKK